MSRHFSTYPAESRQYLFARSSSACGATATNVAVAARKCFHPLAGPDIGEGTGTAESVTGLAVEFCQVVAHVGQLQDISLLIHGESAVRWIDIAQRSAEQPKDPPAPVQLNTVDGPSRWSLHYRPHCGVKQMPQIQLGRESQAVHALQPSVEPRLHVTCQHHRQLPQGTA